MKLNSNEPLPEYDLDPPEEELAFLREQAQMERRVRDQINEWKETDDYWNRCGNYGIDCS